MDAAFAFTLALRMALAASTVVAASVAAERSGPLIGGLLATLPVTAGPAYVFLALDHGSDFVAESALATFANNPAVIVFALVYAALAQRFGVLLSVGLALAAWLLVLAGVRAQTWTMAGATLVNAAAFTAGVALSRPLRSAPMRAAKRRWYDLPMRAVLAAALIGIVVTASSHLGPFGSGVLAAFPIMLLSMVLVLHPRVGGPSAAAVLANSISGLIGFALAMAAVHFAAVPLGAAAALTLALATSVGWNLLVFAGRRRGLPL